MTQVYTGASTSKATLYLPCTQSAKAESSLGEDPAAMVARRSDQTQPQYPDMCLLGDLESTW